MFKFNPFTGKLDYVQISDEVFGVGWSGITTVASSKNATYNEVVKKVEGVGTHKITVSDTEPSNPAIGDLWIDSG